MERIIRMDRWIVRHVFGVLLSNLPAAVQRWDPSRWRGDWHRVSKDTLISLSLVSRFVSFAFSFFLFFLSSPCFLLSLIRQRWRRGEWWWWWVYGRKFRSNFLTSWRSFYLLLSISFRVCLFVCLFSFTTHHPPPTTRHQPTADAARFFRSFLYFSFSFFCVLKYFLRCVGGGGHGEMG